MIFKINKVQIAKNGNGDYYTYSALVKSTKTNAVVLCEGKIMNENPNFALLNNAVFTSKFFEYFGSTTGMEGIDKQIKALVLAQSSTNDKIVEIIKKVKTDKKFLPIELFFDASLRAKLEKCTNLESVYSSGLFEDVKQHYIFELGKRILFNQPTDDQNFLHLTSDAKEIHTQFKQNWKVYQNDMSRKDSRFRANKFIFDTVFISHYQQENLKNLFKHCVENFDKLP